MTSESTEPAEAALAAGEPQVLDAERYNAFVEAASLTAVDVVAVSGERGAAGEAPLVRFDLSAGYQVEGRTIHYRFDGVARLSDSDDVDYVEVKASVIVTVTVRVDPDPACLEMFGAMTTAMTAHPYLREALASTALRLGFPGILMPILGATRRGCPGREVERARGDVPTG